MLFSVFVDFLDVLCGLHIFMPTYNPILASTVLINGFPLLLKAGEGQERVRSLLEIYCYVTAVNKELNFCRFPCRSRPRSQRGTSSDVLCMFRIHQTTQFLLNQTTLINCFPSFCIFPSFTETNSVHSASLKTKNEL